MSYSEIAFASITMTDIVAPGIPSLELLRTDSSSIEANVYLPTADADGGPLTGMNEMLVVLLEEALEGVNPFDGVAAEEIKAFAEVNGGQFYLEALTEADAGTMKPAPFATLIVGKVYWVGVTVKDFS